MVSMDIFYARLLQHEQQQKGSPVRPGAADAFGALALAVAARSHSQPQVIDLQTIIPWDVDTVQAGAVKHYIYNFIVIQCYTDYIRL